MADYNWIFGNGGSWFDPANWQTDDDPSGMGYPGYGSSVQIDDGTAEIALGETAAAQSVDLGGFNYGADAVAQLALLGGELDADSLIVGDAGHGLLSIGNDGDTVGTVNIFDDVSVAAQADSTGTVEVHGHHENADGSFSLSSLSVQGRLYLGGSAAGAGGTAQVSLSDGGLVIANGVTMYSGTTIDIDNSTGQSSLAVVSSNASQYWYGGGVTIDSGAMLTGAGRINAAVFNDGDIFVTGGALQVSAAYVLQGSLHRGAIDIASGSALYAGEVRNQTVNLNEAGSGFALVGLQQNSDFSIGNLAVGGSVTLFAANAGSAHESGDGLVFDDSNASPIAMAYTDPNAQFTTSYNTTTASLTVTLQGWQWTDTDTAPDPSMTGAAGNWNDATYWSDLAGTPTGGVPGATDLVGIGAGTAVVSDYAQASSLWLDGYDGGGVTVTTGGYLSVAHGLFVDTDGLAALTVQGKVVASEIAVGTAGAGSGDIYVDFYEADGASVSVGALDLGANSALYDCGDGSVSAARLTMEGGRVHLGGGLASGTPQMTVGTADGVGNSITVGTDGVINGYGDLEAGVVNDGLVEARGGALRVLSNGIEPLAGSGTWQIDDHASLVLQAPLPTASRIVMNGANATLALGGPATGAPTPEVSGLQASDSIEIADGSTVSSAYADASGLHIVTDRGEILVALAEDHSADSFYVTTTADTVYSGFDTYQILDQGPSCFLAGTVIDTPDGPRAVETLRPGDRVLAGPERAPRAIVWCGMSAYDLSAQADPALVAPIEIAEGAIADGVPSRAVRLSGDHAVCVGGEMVRLRHLLNGGSIRPAALESTTVAYWHVELADAADMMWTASLPCESYHPGEGHGHGGFASCWGEPAGSRPAPPCQQAADILRPIWQALHARSVRLGHAPFVVPDAPGGLPQLIYDGIEIAPLRLSAKLLCFDLPLASGPALLRVPARRPADAEPWSNDRRRLGVAIERIVTLTQGGAAELPIAALSPRDGWWPAEEGARARWTAERALLADPPHGGVLQFHLA